MAQIPREEIERLKRNVSVERLAEARGIKLRRSGKELIGLCPFHADKNPSLNIDPVKNVWHCKGACGKGGDVIRWVMKAEAVSFRHAVEILKADYLPSTASSKPPLVSTVRKLPAPLGPDADDQAALRQVAGYYHDTLKQSPEALKYLESRGLVHPEMVERFRLGFANRTLGLRLPPSNRKAGAIRGRLQKLGLYRDTGHEHFNGSLVIPIFDLAGEVLGMYGRKITYALREGTPLHLYLPGPHRGVWNEEALQVSKEIILCEALIDALTFWCAGYRNVTTCYGVNGFTEDLRAAFRQHGVKQIYIAYDRDEAGDRAAAKHAAEFMEMGIECFRVQFPKGMDANEYARTTQPAGKALGVLLNSASWLGKGLGKDQRPTIATMEPEPVAKTSTEKTEPAAKEEMTIAPPTTPTQEPVLLLAAETSRASLLGTLTEPLIKIDGDEITVAMDGRSYRVLGLSRNSSLGLLKVNVKVTGGNVRGESCYHGDTLDLQNFRQRASYVKQAAHELGAKEEAIQKEVGKLWAILEDQQRENLRKTLEPPKEETILTAEEQDAALALLRDPKLLGRILADFEQCGVVGEEINKKVAYLAAVSRLLDKPLAIVVQSSSSAGKSSLMEAVLGFMPEDQQEQYSAMTGQALFYMGQKNLKHKILAVSEEEGASRAAYALKLLQSEGVLKIASTGKDPVSGKHVTHEYTVEGPVMIILTTTAYEVDEELLNRSIVLTVNEDRAQTRAIHQKQRDAQTIEGMWVAEERAAIVKLHRNAQRLLRPIRVVNEHMQDRSFPDYMIRTRRDHMKFLALVQAVALLHQYQREIKTSTRNGRTLEYIEATAEDVQLAAQLVNEVLAPSLEELQAQTRRLLSLIDEMVKQDCERLQMERADYRFTRATVRQYTRWSDSQLKRHLHRMEELEYLTVHRGGPGLMFVYGLHFEMDESGKPVLPGLAYTYDKNQSGVNGNPSGPEEHSSAPGLGQVRGMSGGGAGQPEPITTGRNGDSNGNHEKNTYPGNGTGDDQNAVVSIPPASLKPNGVAKRAGVK